MLVAILTFVEGLSSSMFWANIFVIVLYSGMIAYKSYKYILRDTNSNNLASYLATATQIGFDCIVALILAIIIILLRFKHNGKNKNKSHYDYYGR